LLNNVWDLKINDYKVIYYSFYAFVTQEKDGKEIVAIDGIKGIINNRLSGELTYALVY